MNMTILDAKQLLLSYFIGNSYIPDDEILSLIDKKTDKENGEASFRIALSQLELSKIISKSTIKNKDIWVLEKPLSLYEQNVILDGQTALKISSYVNRFYQTIGEPDIASNPLNVTKEDISVLLDIIDLYAQSNVPEKKK